MVFSKVKQAGFSLIELMVAISIATFVVSAVLLQFRVFDSVIVLKGFAYEMALTIREAQVFAVSAGIGRNDTFDNPYGIYLDLDNPTEYILFENSNPSVDMAYDSSDYIVERYELDNGFQFNQICLDAVCSSAREVSIVYERPEFDAIFAAWNSAGGSIATGAVSEVSIRLESTQNPAQYFDVIAGVTGQVSVAGP